ncbi:hypothetical protein AsAng_0007600 [Aureispira anguillae]|uniref:Uncharacterized protein n=1 Tax=Aureispira anguillae TaxID=2864201 RepID=A0A915YBJ6_9BACT|nr:hypothetical protein AsAng_0007600 [Aureispira anguillae]
MHKGLISNISMNSYISSETVFLTNPSINYFSVSLCGFYTVLGSVFQQTIIT